MDPCGTPSVTGSRLEQSLFYVTKLRSVKKIIRDPIKLGSTNSILWQFT